MADAKAQMPGQNRSTSPGRSRRRAERIPLDYYKHRDGFKVARGAACCLVTLLAAGWIATGVDWFGILEGRDLLSAVGKSRASPAALAKVHSAWDAQCEVCHVPYKPVTAGHWWSDAKAGFANARCEACHLAPAHHPNEKPETRIAECAACHIEHRGRQASLISLENSQCTQCHASLKSKSLRVETPADRLEAPADRLETAITEFSLTGHPQFDDLKAGSDPGRLKFNHAQHMTLGIPKANDPKSTPFFVYGAIAQKDQHRYQRAARSMTPPQNAEPLDYVQLDCASCHQLDSREGMVESFDSTPALSGGKRFLPIAYDRHCAACHALEVPVSPTQLAAHYAANPRPNQNANREAPNAIQTIRVRHGGNPGEVIEEVKRALIGYALTGEVDKQVPWPTPSMPGGTSGLSRIPQDALLSDLNTVLDDLFMTAQKNCSECHSYTSGDGRTWFADPNAPRDPDFKARIHAGDFEVETVRIPEMWLTKARFSHPSHQVVDCRFCHAKAYPDEKDCSRSQADVLIPGIENCVVCHSPARVSNGRSVGGVRRGCTDCHAYHGHQAGDAPPLGPAAFRPKTRLDDAYQRLAPKTEPNRRTN